MFFLVSSCAQNETRTKVYAKLLNGGKIWSLKINIPQNNECTDQQNLEVSEMEIQCYENRSRVLFMNDAKELCGHKSARIFYCRSLIEPTLPDSYFMESCYIDCSRVRPKEVIVQENKQLLLKEKLRKISAPHK